MTGEQGRELERRPRVERERVIRILTFWLRPEFALRVVNRFQKIAGFDRSIALASSALTATIPLAIVISAIASRLGGKGVAERITERYDLTGGGADAVRDLLAPASDASTSLGVVGFVFLMLTALSFTRVVQRLFEQSWELTPLSMRNTANGLLWVGGLVLYVSLSGLIHGLLGRGALELAGAVVAIPLSAVFLVWTGSVLSGGRIARHDLVPFAVVGAILLALYWVGAQLYMPHLFSTYATRYGVIGAVFAIISAFFCIMVVIVGSAAAGREIRDELDRIDRGERPAPDEVRRQWEAVTTEARSRWGALRARRQKQRRNRERR